MALLSQAERALLSGVKEFSKTQQRYIRYKLRRKIKEFYNVELPLLMEKGYIIISDNNNNKECEGLRNLTWRVQIAPRARSCLVRLMVHLSLRRLSY